MDKDDFVETGKREIQKQFLWPFWRPFIIAWIICNWKAIYATAFLSEEAIKALSNEKNKLSFVIDLYEKTFLWGNFFGYSLGDHFVLNVFFFCLFIPALAAFVNTFFISHRVGTWFYSKECETDERKRRAKEKAKEIAKKELEEVKLAKLKISDEIKTKEEENEKKWNEEFMKLEEMQDI